MFCHACAMCKIWAATAEIGELYLNSLHLQTQNFIYFVQSWTHCVVGVSAQVLKNPKESRQSTSNFLTSWPGQEDRMVHLNCVSLMIVGFLIGYLCFQSYVNGDDRYGTSQGTYEYGSSLTNARGVSKAEYSEENMPKILLMGLRRYWHWVYTKNQSPKNTFQYF